MSERVHIKWNKKRYSATLKQINLKGDCSAYFTPICVTLYKRTDGLGVFWYASWDPISLNIVKQNGPFADSAQKAMSYLYNQLEGVRRNLSTSISEVNFVLNCGF